MTNSPNGAHSEPLIKELGWFIIKQLFDKETAKIGYQALHNEEPEYIQAPFHSMFDTQSRVLRNSNTDLHVPLMKTSTGQKSFVYRGPRDILSNAAKNL